MPSKALGEGKFKEGALTQTATYNPSISSTIMLDHLQLRHGHGYSKYLRHTSQFKLQGIRSVVEHQKIWKCSTQNKLRREEIARDSEVATVRRPTLSIDQAKASIIAEQPN